MILTSQEVYDWLGFDGDTVSVFSANNTFKFYVSPTTYTITISDGLYTPSNLATELQAKMNASYNHFTVTYSSTTRKFTIVSNASAFQFLRNGSTAGYLFGFNQDSTSSTTTTSNVSIDSETSVIDAIHEYTEDFYQKYLKRNFEVATYTEIHDTEQGNFLFLNNFPVTSVSSFTVNDETVSASDYEINLSVGQIYYPTGFVDDFQGATIVYSAGYSTIPPTIKLGLKNAIKYIYTRWQESSDSLTQYSIDGMKKIFTNYLDADFMAMLGLYKNYMV